MCTQLFLICFISPRMNLKVIVPHISLLTLYLHIYFGDSGISMHMYMHLISLGLFITEKEVTFSLPRHIIVWDEESPIRVLYFYLKCLHKLYDIAQYFAKYILQMTNYFLYSLNRKFHSIQGFFFKFTIVSANDSFYVSTIRCKAKRLIYIFILFSLLFNPLSFPCIH